MVAFSSLLQLGVASALLPLAFASAIEKRACPANTVCQTLNLTWSALSPDGYSRNVFQINGQFPGPRLTMTQYQKAQFTVINSTPFNQTVHWHGIEQLNTAYSDGVPGVSQNNIPPGGKFLYQFNATESGAYWYHSHASSRLQDGLYGPLVINAPSSTTRPFSAINSTTAGQAQLLAAEGSPNVVMAADWSHHTSDDYFAIEQASDVDIICFDSVLISGKGSAYCLSRTEIDSLTNPALQPALNGSKLTDKGCIPANNTAAQGPYPKDLSKLPKDVFDVCSASTGSTTTYTVDASKGYAAFHFYNSGALNVWTIGIDEHSMWVFAVDGHYMQPQKVDSIVIEPGARISVFVPLVKKAANYVIRVSNAGFNQIIFGTAVMSYLNGDTTYTSKQIINKVGQNTTYPYTQFNIDKYQIYPPKAPATYSNQTFRLDIGRFGAKSWQWTLSGKEAYNLGDEDAPALLFNYNSAVGKDSNISVSTKYGEWVDFIIQSTYPPANPGHPLHKHANKAYIIGRGTGNFTWPDVATAQKATPASFNLANPVLRDGFLTAGAQFNATWMVIRYQVLNPGPWIFHCHIQPHVAGGMAINILDAVDKWPIVPPAYANGGNGF